MPSGYIPPVPKISFARNMGVANLMKSRYSHAIRHCAARRPSRKKRKGVAQRVPGVGWMEVFQKGSPAASNLRCWNPTHSVAFQKLRQSPEHPQRVPCLITRQPGCHSSQNCICIWPPPGRDDDGLPASRASRNPTTPPYILPPVRADMMADLSGYWGPCALPASRRWDVALAVVGSRRYRVAKNPFSTRPGRRLQSATSATMLETWCHQAVETTNLSRRLQPPSREPDHARSPFRHPTRGNPRIMFPQARFLGHVLDTACARVGAGAAAGSRLIDGVEVPGLG